MVLLVGATQLTHTAHLSFQHVNDHPLKWYVPRSALSFVMEGPIGM